jgi:hypothetical protein
LDSGGDQQLPVAHSPIVIRREGALARLDAGDLAEGWSTTSWS